MGKSSLLPFALYDWPAGTLHSYCHWSFPRQNSRHRSQSNTGPAELQSPQTSLMGGPFIREPIDDHNGPTGSRDGIRSSRGLVKVFKTDGQHNFADSNDRITRLYQYNPTVWLPLIGLDSVLAFDACCSRIFGLVLFFVIPFP